MPAYMDLSSGPVHWVDFGGEGKPIVLVHGLGGSVANWNIVGPRLAQMGHVVSLDLPGFGLSPPGPDWTLDTHAAAITDFTKQFDEPAIVVGNSLGGLLSKMVAARHPELVSALLLVAPATPPRLPDPRIDWPMAARLLVGSTPGIGPAMSRRVLATTTSSDLINDSLRRIAHKPSRVPMSLVEEFVSLAETRRNFPWAADAVPRTAQSIRATFMRRSRYVALIRAIRAPTMVVQGLDDPIVSPTSVEWLCSLRPDWQLVQMDDTGHTPQIDAPIRFLETVRPWLESHLDHEITA